MKIELTKYWYPDEQDYDYSLTPEENKKKKFEKEDQFQKEHPDLKRLNLEK